MNPTVSDVHVSTPLTTISVAFLQRASDFIADRAFPNIPVAKQADVYYSYDRGEFNRDEMQERAPATESAGGGYSVDADSTYYARQYSFHKDVPDQMRANADAAINPDRDATNYVTHKALIKREKLFATRFLQTGIWGTDMTGVASGPNASQFLKWSDANSDPIKNVRDGKRAVRESTGVEPNKLILGRVGYDALVDHPDIIDRVKYGQTAGAPAKGTLSALQDLLEIPEILVMNAIENTAKEGQPASHSFIGGNVALLCHSASQPGLMVPTAGYTFLWTGLMGATGNGNRIRQFRMDNLQCDRVEIDMCFDQKVVAADLGYMFDAVT